MFGGGGSESRRQTEERNRPHGQLQLRMKFFGYLLIIDAPDSSHELCHHQFTTKTGEQLNKVDIATYLITFKLAPSLTHSHEHHIIRHQ